MCIGLHVKYRCSCQILIKIEIFDKFSKNSQKSNFMKTCPVGAELLLADRRREGQTDRQTYMTKLIVAFRIFCERA